MTFLIAAGVGAAGAIAGGLISSRGASKAAATQAAAADAATALQGRMYDETVARNQPYIQAGTLAQNRLLSLLGLQADPAYGGTAPGASSYSGPTREQLRNELIGQYTTPASQGQWVNGAGMDGIGGGWTGGTPGGIDEAGLQAAIEQRYQQGINSAPIRNNLNASSTDPNFGKYGRDPTMADIEIDPGYQFRLDEGLKALDRTASARGGLLSGGALKAATRYGQNMGSQEYQNAYGRYQTNRANQLNPLGSLMSSGQNAANNTGAASQNYASAAGAGMMASGQATAAGQMGSANTINNALNSMGSTYQNAVMMNQLFNKPAATPAASYTWYDE